MNSSKPLDLSAIFQVLMRRKRFATRVLLVFLIAGVALAFLLPPTYEGVAVILAPQETDLFGAFANARRALGSLSALSLLSQSNGASDEYGAILKSDNVYRAVARRFDLMKVYHHRNLDRAVISLRRNARISINADGSITVAVQDRQRARAADLANAFIEELDRFNQDRRVKRWQALARFLEAQIETTAVGLRRNEELVRQFGESRHAPVISSEDRAAAEGAATLLARRAALDVRRQVLSSYLDPTSDEMAQTDIEISSVNREIAKLPSLMLGGARLIRDLRVEEELFALLKAQLEQARVKAAFDVATVEVLDRAHPPEIRSRPNRKLVVAGMLFLGFLAALAGSLLAERRETSASRGRSG